MNERPRQRVIVSLGHAAINPVDRRVIAGRVEAALRGQSDLIATPATAEQRQWVDRILRKIHEKGIRAYAELLPPPTSGATIPGPRLDQIEHSRSTPLGPELAGLKAWNDLHLSEALHEAGLNPSQIRAAQAVVLNRLVEPVSEHALRDWLDNASSLPELLGESFQGQHIEGRFYRIGDQLHKHAPALEAHLRKRQKSLFAGRSSVYLCDLTNTYFEGRAEANPEARRGHSKEKRSDCPLVALALLYSEEGLPLGHRVFAGNTHDGKAFGDRLNDLEADWSEFDTPRCDAPKPLFILDSGIATETNLRRLRTKGYDYLVAERRPSRGAHAETFADESGYTDIPAKGVRVKKDTLQRSAKFPAETASSPTNATGTPDDAPANAPDDIEEIWEETVLYCHSEARATKETAMLEKARQRLETDLAKLRERLRAGRLRNPVKAAEAIGRLRQRHSAAAYDIELVYGRAPEPKVQKAKKTARRSTLSPAAAKVPCDLTWSLRDQTDRATTLCGYYCLRSTRDFPEGAAHMWNFYMNLSRAEDGFRCLKSHLGLRPVWHHKSERVRAHLFISVLALHLLCYIRRRLEEAGQPPRDWTTLKLLLRPHAYATLSLVTAQGTHHLRKPGKPNEVQKSIYAALGIDPAVCPIQRIHVPRSAQTTLSV